MGKESKYETIINMKTTTLRQAGPLDKNGDIQELGTKVEWVQMADRVLAIPQ